MCGVSPLAAKKGEGDQPEGDADNSCEEKLILQ
jgi:hypothetical protein